MRDPTQPRLTGDGELIKIINCRCRICNLFNLPLMRRNPCRSAREPPPPLQPPSLICGVDVPAVASPAQRDANGAGRRGWSDLGYAGGHDGGCCWPITSPPLRSGGRGLNANGVFKRLLPCLNPPPPVQELHAIIQTPEPRALRNVTFPDPQTLIRISGTGKKPKNPGKVPD